MEGQLVNQRKSFQFIFFEISFLLWLILNPYIITTEAEMLYDTGPRSHLDNNNTISPVIFWGA